MPARFAIVVGHEALHPGAHAVAPLDCYEYDYNRDLAKRLQAALLDQQITSEVFLRDGVGIAGAYRRVGIYAPLGCVELHFNAANAQARGTETLWATPQSKGLADVLQVYQCQVLGRQGMSRGSLECLEAERGRVNLTQIAAPSVIIEPFFGDQVDDAKLGLDLKGALAVGLAQGIAAYVRGLPASVRLH